MTPEDKIKELEETVSKLVSQIKIIQKRTDKQRGYLIAENMVLNECLHDVFTYADFDIRERHGDEEYIAKDLKSMIFKAQRKVEKLRQEEKFEE